MAEEGAMTGGRYGLVLGHGQKGGKTFCGETRIEALIDQEEVEKMGMLQDAISLEQLRCSHWCILLYLCVILRI